MDDILAQLPDVPVDDGPKGGGGGGAGGGGHHIRSGSIQYHSPASQPPSGLSTTRAAGQSLSAEEVDVLRRGSIINGKVFVPWMDADEKVSRLWCVFQQAGMIYRTPVYTAVWDYNKLHTRIHRCSPMGLTECGTSSPPPLSAAG